MMRSLSIAAFLAGRDAKTDVSRDGPHAPRPTGTIVWARCSHPDQLTAMDNLNRKLAEDGDEIRIIVTLPDTGSPLPQGTLPEPQGKANIRGFIQHWLPTIAVWVAGDLHPLVLEELRKSNIRSIWIDARPDGLETFTGRWLPGAVRALLAQFELVIAADQATADRLARAGTPPQIITISGAMEDSAPPLPYREADRQKLAQAIGTRPVWLAAAARANDCLDLCAAQKEASRSAHRLLLVVVPADTAQAPDLAQEMRAQGFHVTLQSQEPAPTEPTQIHIVDTNPDLGLWYRIAPITYLGGTMHGGGCRDPFEATALGSAVLYGPQVAPFQKHCARLNAAGASRLIRSAHNLGPTVESLLATDKVAILAHAAWDVTSRGAEVTNQIVAVIQRRLDLMDT